MSKAASKGHTRKKQGGAILALGLGLGAAGFALGEPTGDSISMIGALLLLVGGVLFIGGHRLTQGEDSAA